MSSLTFNQLAGTPLYQADCGVGAASQVYYLLNSGNPGSTITFDDSWNTYQGTYIFTPAPIANPATFVQAYQKLNIQNLGFAWVANPNDTQNRLNFTLLVTQKVGKSHLTASSTQQFAFNNIYIIIGSNCNVNIDDQNNLFTISQNNSNIFFQIQPNIPQLHVIGPNLYLPLCGPQAGCLQFQMTLSQLNLDQFDAGIRYFFETNVAPGVASLRYPIFSLPNNATISPMASFDPLNPLDGARTYFSFMQQAKPGVAPPTPAPIASYFRSNLGQIITLTPGPDARLVLANNPTFSQPTYYLMPAGTFAVAVTQSAQKSSDSSSAPVERFMCGVSGVEYVGLMTEAGNLLTFFPGQPAYADGFVPGGQSSTQNGTSSSSLTSDALTSWAYVTPPTNGTLKYYAQPDDAVLYQPGSGPQGYLSFMEVTACALPSSITPPTSSLTEGDGSTPTMFPMVPFAGINDTALANYFQLEVQLLSPARRNIINQLAGMNEQKIEVKAAVSLDDADKQGTTPQGMLATFDSTLQNWKTLTLAQTTTYTLTPQVLSNLQTQGNVPPSVIAELQPLENITYANTADYEAALQAQLSSADYKQYLNVLLQYAANPQQFQLLNVTGALKSALQTNQLFLVITSKTDFQQNCSLANYKLTDLAFSELQADANVPASVLAELQPLKDILYTDINSYETALQSELSSSDYTQYRDALLEYGSYAQFMIEDWIFDLSPNTWDSHQTTIIFKFYNKTVEDLANDTSTWANAISFNKSVADVQTMLQNIISDAKQKWQTDKVADFEYFVDQVVTNPSWNGILFLNSYVPLNDLPPQLEGIAAGINPANFYAHHLGVNVTPVNSNTSPLTMQDSSLFGLIYYDDPQDLTYQSGVDYQFKVLNLEVLFENSTIADFASKIELMLNRLFGEPVAPPSSGMGNNLILNGVYQKHDGQDSYVFTEQGDNVFKMKSHVVEAVEILQAQFVTLNQSETKVQTRFMLWGNLEFHKLAGFDAFSFGNSYKDGKLTFQGGLSFYGLFIDMDFVPSEGSSVTPTFTFDATQIAFDIAKSAARPDSLYNHFPLSLDGLLQAKEQTAPTDLGYLSVNSPLNQSTLSYPWFALVYDLNLGTAGALAAKAGFTASVIFAWAPNADSYNTFIGVKLPGTGGAKKELSLQSVLKLKIKNIEFTVGDSSAYMLKFNNITLSLLSVAFPPYGQTNVLLFGDPSRADNTTLGWYAAYANKPKAAPAKQLKNPDLPRLP